MARETFCVLPAATLVARWCVSIQFARRSLLSVFVMACRLCVDVQRNADVSERVLVATALSTHYVFVKLL